MLRHLFIARVGMV